MSDMMRTSGADATKMSQSDEVDHAVDNAVNNEKNARKDDSASANPVTSPRW
jgi:hypothetical protein